MEISAAATLGMYIGMKTGRRGWALSREGAAVLERRETTCARADQDAHALEIDRIPIVRQARP
jgi:hypothetical protein